MQARIGESAAIERTARFAKRIQDGRRRILGLRVSGRSGDGGRPWRTTDETAEKVEQHDRG
jgi:hypothetical protein